MLLGFDLFYYQGGDELIRLVLGMGDGVVNRDQLFRFADYPISDEATRILRSLYSRVYAEIRGDIAQEWQAANLKNDAFVKGLFGDGAVDGHYARYFEHNKGAMDTFFERKSKADGLDLSKRVWKYSGQFRDEMEMAIDVSLGEGLSADKLSRHVRGYLNEPDRLFRRVRDKNGQLVLSGNARAYHPGQGVYRSSYRNAMRLARTETNMAYRRADELRWQQMDFVVGYEVKLSRSHPVPDICDDLAGRYPKSFVFVGWHPQCFCYVVPILCKPSEMDQLNTKLLAGEPTDGLRFDDEVKEVPARFTDWIDKHGDRASGSVRQPYFIRDNYKGGVISGGLIGRTDGLIGRTHRPTKITPVYGNKDTFDKIVTIADVERYVVDQHLADKVSFLGFSDNHVVIAKEMIKSFEEHYNKFPELREKVSFIGSIQGRVELLRKHYFDIEYARELSKYTNPTKSELLLAKKSAQKRSAKMVMGDMAGKHTMAYSASSKVAGVNGIAWNSKFTDNLDEVLARDVSSGFHPVGCDKIKFIIDHELGHKVDELLGLHKDAEFIALLRDSKFTDKAYIGDNLSRYAFATRDGGEFIAEAWGEYLNNPKPRLIAMKLGELIEAKYKKVHK